MVMLILKEYWEVILGIVGIIAVLVAINYSRQKWQTHVAASATAQSEIHHAAAQTEAIKGGISEQQAKDLQESIQIAKAHAAKSEAEVVRLKAELEKVSTAPHQNAATGQSGLLPSIPAIGPVVGDAKDRVIIGLTDEVTDLKDVVAKQDFQIIALTASKDHFKKAYEQESLARNLDHIAAVASIKAAEDWGVRREWLGIGIGLSSGIAGTCIYNALHK